MDIDESWRSAARVAEGVRACARRKEGSAERRPLAYPFERADPTAEEKR